MTTTPLSFTEAADDDLLESDSVKMREERLEVSLPVRLIRNSVGGLSEVIPAVLVNVSASGLQLLTDRRFSLLLPPLLGTQFAVEFFLGRVEIRHVGIEVVRSEKRDAYTIILGGKFINLPSEARLSLRSTVTAGAVSSRR